MDYKVYRLDFPEEYFNLAQWHRNKSLPRESNQISLPRKAFDALFKSLEIDAK